MQWYPGDRHQVNGVTVEMLAPSMWGWRLTGGCLWTFELFGHKLHCEGVLIAEGCGSLGRAVNLSQGYEMGVADMVRKANREAQAMSREAKRKRGLLEMPGDGQGGEG